jgi:F-type H+-transporting ATPase subunit epsilon
MSSLLLEIITPEGKAYSDQVEYVLLPTAEGVVDILPGHVPILSMIEPGKIEVSRNGHKELLAVDKGFARVMADHVSVLTEAAIDVDEIDLGAVEEAEAKAKEALKAAQNKVDIDPAEIERLEAITRFSIAQKIAKQKKL